MRCDVLAIGTELLLGQIVDTNSAWLGEHLAEFGIDTCEHRKVGDNLPRMVTCLRELLERADAVIVCGGLGPTPDDVTREAIAEVMGVELERREELIEQIQRLFGSRGREMPSQQPAPGRRAQGRRPHPQSRSAPRRACSARSRSTAPPRSSTRCRACPTRWCRWSPTTCCPICSSASGERSVIVSRSLKTWGTSESGLAEMIADRVDQQTNPTIAFLARGIEGLYVRMTAKAPTEAEALALLDTEDRELRKVLGELVFAVDDDTMESEVLRLCEARGWSLGVAESLTGGFIGARIANVPGASRTFKGSLASYATEVKRELLGVTADSVVGEESAKQMAEGAQKLLGADVTVSVTGVAGPDEMDGQPVGTVWYAVAIPGHATEALSARLPGDRERIRQFSTISALNLLRMRLLALP